MPQYTTGELAKLCGVTVRTVQFYDTKGILCPSALTEGGRRIYSDQDLKQLRLICLLKTMGLTLESIKEILVSKAPDQVLQLLLEEQLHRVEGEIAQKEEQRRRIMQVKSCLEDAKTIPAQSIQDIEQMMKEQKRLKTIYMTMLAAGLIMDVIEIGLLVWWIFTGMWVPFAVGMAVVVMLGILVTRYYYHHTAYRCPQCRERFRPALKAFLFSAHTPKTRKLCCPKCGYQGFCVETASETEEK